MSEVWNPLAGADGVGLDGLVGLVDAAPIGGILLDEDLCVRHANIRALRILGVESKGDDLRAVIERSRTVRPSGLWDFVQEAFADPPGRSYHLIEAVDGTVRCIEVSVHSLADALGVCWLRDVTDTQQLRQFRLLAEIGRSAGDKPSTSELADRLLDAILETLNIDIAVLAVRERDGILRPVATRGMMFEESYVLDPSVHPYVEKAILSQAPVVSDGSEWESGELAEVTGLHYVLPLVDAGRVIGTLHLGALGSNVPFQTAEMAANASRFTLDTLDAALLEALSAYAGSALANVRLFDEIRDEQAKFATVVDAIPEGLLVFNSRGDVQIANSTAREIAGLDWVNLNTDVRPYRLRTVDGDLIPRADWPFFRVVRTAEPVLGEVVIMDFGEVRKHVLVNVVPVPVGDSKNAAFVATLQDVTRRTEIQRRRMEFVSVASHELRSPLTPLTGFLQMIRKQAEQGGEVDPTLIGRAQQQVKRLSRLIETLLDATRIETGRIELDLRPVDLRDTLLRIADLWSSHPKGVEIEAGVPSHPVICLADADRLEQVLTNLVDNAVKHSPPDGVVQLEANVRGDCAEVIVRDNGRGIAPDHLPRVFDRFFSTGEGGRGLGLGLFISRQIVERHGGTIRLESELGEYTAAIIELPLATH